MERAFFRDEPMIIFIPIYCFLVFNFEFTFFRGIAQRLPLCVQLGQPFCNVPKVVSNPLANFLQGVSGYWQPSGKFVTESEVIGNPLTDSPEGIDKFCK
jgi:hypothetical protein